VWSQQGAQRAIVVAGCLAMAYTQLTMSPATIEYARTLGAAGLHIGILGALPTGMLFMQFLAAVIANHLRYRRWLWFSGSIIQRLLFVPVVAGPLLFPQISDGVWIWVFIAATAANHAMLHFATPLWLSWMGDYLPHKGLNRFWGIRHLWMQYSAALSLLLGAIYMKTSGAPIRESFMGLIAVGAIMGVIDLLLFLKVEEPPVTPLAEPKLGLVLSAPFRNKNFRSFILFTCFWHLAAMSGAPFISFFLFADLGMTAPMVLLVWTFSWIGGAFFSKRLGHLAEEYGNRPVLILCTAFKSANMIALLLMPRVPSLAFWLLVPVFMLDALLNAGIAIANNGFMLKNSPAENRSMYIAAGTAVAGMVGGLTSIAAGGLLSVTQSWSYDVLWIHANGFHLLFLISLILRIIAAFLARSVREPETHDTIQVVVQLVGITPLRVLRFPVGLYRSFREGENNGSREPTPSNVPAEAKPSLEN